MYSIPTKVTRKERLRATRILASAVSRGNQVNFDRRDALMAAKRLLYGSDDGSALTSAANCFGNLSITDPARAYAILERELKETDGQDSDSPFNGDDGDGSGSGGSPPSGFYCAFVGPPIGPGPGSHVGQLYFRPAKKERPLPVRVSDRMIIGAKAPASADCRHLSSR
jgi:hypothetical protein